MSHITPTIRRRRRGAPIAVGLAVLTGVALTFSMTPAFSGFTASLSNNAGVVSSGTLLMSETQGGTTCLSSTGSISSTNAATCGINHLGGTTSAVPGTTYTSTVTIKNTGNSDANTFTLTPTACSGAVNSTLSITGTDTAGFCGKVNFTIQDTTDSANPICVFPASSCATPTSSNTLASLGSSALSLAALSSNTSRTYTFTTKLDSSATNADQGLLANSTITWAFSS